LTAGDQVVIVDLDHDIVQIPANDPLPHPPPEALQLQDKLRQYLFPQLADIGRVFPKYSRDHLVSSPEDLRENQRYFQRRIRRCFLAFFVSLFREYTQYISDSGQFNEKRYLENFTQDGSVCSSHHQSPITNHQSLRRMCACAVLTV
jgi:hypothetical protein